MLIIKSIIQFLTFKASEYNKLKKAKQSRVRFVQKIIDDGDNFSLARFYNAKGDRIRGKSEGLRKSKPKNTNLNLHPLEIYYSNK